MKPRGTLGTPERPTAYQGEGPDLGRPGPRYRNRRGGLGRMRVPFYPLFYWAAVAALVGWTAYSAYAALLFS